MSAKERIGVVLFNLGGPTSDRSVRAFLENLFSDKDIIHLGGGRFQALLAKVIASLRAKKSAQNYRAIHGCRNGCEGSIFCPEKKSKKPPAGCSPINPLTEQQRKALQELLQKRWPGHEINVYTAMRYGHPFDHQALKQALSDGAEHLFLLPLYPQFSYTTTGSSFRNWEKIQQQHIEAGLSLPWKEYRTVSWHLNRHYLRALNKRIDEALLSHFDEKERKEVHFLFSAHGTPLKEVRSGDPYTRHIEETVQAVMALRGNAEAFWLGYQSRVGPMAWTAPSVRNLAFRLIDYGVKHLLIIPVSFVTDHIETLYELDIELRNEINHTKKSLKKMVVTRGLNDHPDFILALADEIEKKTEHIPSLSESYRNQT